LARRAAKATEGNIIVKNGDQKSQSKASSISAMERLTDPKTSASILKQGHITSDKHLREKRLNSNYGNNNERITIRSNTREKKRKKIISSKITKFGNGFTIPDDMNKR
jgi:hypothetical protein